MRTTNATNATTYGPSIPPFIILGAVAVVVQVQIMITIYWGVLGKYSRYLGLNGDGGSYNDIYNNVYHFSGGMNDALVVSESMEILSTVPVGFSLNLLPRGLMQQLQTQRETKGTGWGLGSKEVTRSKEGNVNIKQPSNANEIQQNKTPLQIYFNSEYVATINDPSKLPTPHQYHFGTCGIPTNTADNVLQHAFSVHGLSEEENLYLDPGRYFVKANRVLNDKKENGILSRFMPSSQKQVPYAQLTIEVRAPPKFIVGTSSWSSSPTSASEYQTAYDLAIREMGSNIACDRFVAGSGWTQLWTRDTSYAAELAAALIHPKVVKESLRGSVEIDYGGDEVLNNEEKGGDDDTLDEDDEYDDDEGKDDYDGVSSFGQYIKKARGLNKAKEVGRKVRKEGKQVWLQDRCGHFGGWPNLSDAIVGVRGAWAVYLVDGDLEFLRWAYQVTLNSLERAERDVLDEDTGLFGGCSSFMESNSGYPRLYKNNGKAVKKTKALSTNLLYYSGYDLASKMGRELKAPDSEIDTLVGKALKLKLAIQTRLWSSDMKTYAYVEDKHGDLLEHEEGLGISLALLDMEDVETRIESIFGHTSTTKYGIPCLWPQFDLGKKKKKDISNYYHNGRLWPFVQGYWAMAAAQHKQVDIFTDALKSLLALSQMSNTFAEFYEIDGSFMEERKSQLWSDTGYLAMIYYGVFGMRYEVSGIRFAPIKSKDLFGSEVLYLKNLQYRNMILNIELHGYGTTVTSFEVNEKIQSEAFVKATGSGIVNVKVIL